MADLSAPTLNLDPDSIKEIVRGAIMQSLDAKAQERLIAGALDYLLTESPQRIPGRPSRAPIENIFNDAVAKAARDIVFDAFANDPRVQDAIKEIVHPMVQRLCDGNYEGLPETIGDAFGQWLQSQKQYTS